MAKYQVTSFQGVLLDDVEKQVNSFLDFKGRVLVNASITTEIDPNPVDEDIPNMYTILVAYYDQIE